MEIEPFDDSQILSQHVGDGVDGIKENSNGDEEHERAVSSDGDVSDGSVSSAQLQVVNKPVVKSKKRS